MKKKILLISLMVVMLVCLFAVSISARTNYREEQTYNYYDTDGNLLYSATTIYAIDNNYSGKYRYEIIIRESGDGFAKYDANGTPITWYVVSDDAKDQKIGGDSQEQDGVINIVVASTPTIGGAGTVDSNGAYTYGGGTVSDITAKKVVSANFFETGVKTFANDLFFATATVAPNGNSNEYCKIADGSYLLCLYLPKTLTKLPNRFCARTPLRVLEFEDNMISCTGNDSTITYQKANNVEYGPFGFCANLKKLVIPEGITVVKERSFRECVSLSYIKLANTMTRMDNNAFFRSSNVETFIMGENMTFCGYFTGDIVRFYVEDTRPSSAAIKYYYVSTKLNTKTDFESYRGAGQNVTTYGDFRDVIFMFPGTLAQAISISQYTGDSFKATVDSSVAQKKNMTYNEAISYATYIANKEYYDTQITHHLLVYDVPNCVAFYDGHDFKNQNTYENALTPFKIGDICQRCGTIENATEYAPILEFLGYSAKIGGDMITFGYKVNKESLELFPELSYGVLAVVPGENADMSAYEPLNPDLTPAYDNKMITSVVDKKYNDFNLIINSFSKNSEYYEIPVVMCAYVADGEKVDYICYNGNDGVSINEYAVSITFKEVATVKYNLTFACDSAYGTIEGETSQLVEDGNKISKITAVANDGYQFACWSNGMTDATLEYAPEGNEDLFAYFTPKSTGLPVITINTDGGVNITTKEYYIGCEITLLDTETGGSIGGQLAEIKGRGNSTWTKFDKKAYKFKFEDKQNLFGYGAEKTWVLLADARDYSLVRNMLAYNAGLTMSELGYTSMGQSVELYLNGEYRGVYYLCEQIQVKENRVNITQEDDEIVQGPDDVGYLIEMDAWVAEDQGGAGSIPTYGVTSDGDVFVRVDDGMYNGYVIKDPEDILFDADGNLKEDFMLYVQNYIKNSLAAVSGDDYNAVCEYIDVKSFAQAYIIFDLFKNPDTQYSSVYFYKDVNGKLVAAPLWDFDMAIGNVTHKANAGTNASNFRDTTFLWTAQKNTWFRELLEFSEFKALVGQELADNADALRASIASDLAYAREHADAYKKNFEKWNLIGNTSASEAMGNWSIPDEFKAFTTWEEHLDYIKNYLAESLAYLIETYPAPVTE